MNQALAVSLMLNNYVHDVATGLLIISALWLGWSARELGPSPGAETVEYFKRTYRRCVRFVIGSIVVIVATGIVRTIFFMDFEWTIAMGKSLVPVLVAKHVLIVVLLGVGIYAWSGIRKRVRSLGSRE